ncbi:MAG: hypothetical protein U0P45_15595 [Acidimicrobiales bacterium]
MHKTTALAAIVLSAALGLAACSSSDDGADATTTTKAKATTTKAADATPASRDATCAEIAKAVGSYQPHIDDIFANGNDDPTLAEWAAFLPKELDAMQQALDAAKAVEVPADDPDLAAALDQTISDFDAVHQDLADSQAAAAKGDEAAFKAAEAKNQGADGEALQKSSGVVGELCGFPQS